MNSLKYNENQKEAIGWNEGAVMVLAGPGAGKTTVLTDRIARLVQETPEESFRVLALTFTRQAAKEMKRRLEKSLGDDVSRVEAETFHAFAMDVLLRYGSVINLKPDFIISENGADCRQILQKILAKVELQGMDAENVLSGFDVILRNGLSAEELLAYINKRQDIADRFSQLQSVFEDYVEALIKESVMDYPMMLYLAKYVLETHPKLLERIRLIYKYFCVDEFQDTTVIQYRILGLIAPPGANVFVVADDDQTIFEWNGANPLRVKEFIREYEANIIQLPQNYRCPDEIVKMSNALIIRNTERYAGKIQCYSSNKDKDVVGYATFYDWDSEVRGLCKNIKDSIPTNSRHNCLVIARNNWMLKDVKRIFAECGVAAEIIAQRNEFASSQVSWVYHYLRFIRYPQSKVELEKVCLCTEKLTMQEFAVSNIYDRCALQGLTEADVLHLAFKAISGWSRISDVCDKYRFKMEHEFENFSAEVFPLLDPNYSSEEYEDPDYISDKLIWDNAINEFRSEGKTGLSNFLQDLSMTAKMPSISNDCVRLQTVHTSKGSEADNVYIVGLADGIFPSYQSLQPRFDGKESPQLQEERRNFFVALTRTIKHLYLSRANLYKGYSKSPSRFLYEIGLESHGNTR